MKFYLSLLGANVEMNNLGAVRIQLFQSTFPPNPSDRNHFPKISIRKEGWRTSFKPGQEPFLPMRNKNPQGSLWCHGQHQNNSWHCQGPAQPRESGQAPGAPQGLFHCCSLPLLSFEAQGCQDSVPKALSSFGVSHLLSQHHCSCWAPRTERENLSPESRKGMLGRKWASWLIYNYFLTYSWNAKPV